jgi:hypothetical protein
VEKKHRTIMKNIFLVFAILFLTCVQCLLAQSQEDEKLLRKKHMEYLKPRMDGRQVKMNILFGDLNGDGKEDAFIDWCIEATDKDREVEGGGNAMMFLGCWEEGYSVYINNGKEWLLTSDKRKSEYHTDGFAFSVDFINSGKIICSREAYAEDDARCCPSLKESIYLVYQNHKLLKPEQKMVLRKKKD